LSLGEISSSTGASRESKEGQLPSLSAGVLTRDKTAHTSDGFGGTSLAGINHDEQLHHVVVDSDRSVEVRA